MKKQAWRGLASACGAQQCRSTGKGTSGSGASVGLLRSCSSISSGRWPESAPVDMQKKASAWPQLARRATVGCVLRFAGIGLHSGEAAEVALVPAPAGHEIVFSD